MDSYVTFATGHAHEKTSNGEGDASRQDHRFSSDRIR